MSKIDTYYQAFKDYRKKTKDNSSLLMDRNNLNESNQELDSFVTKKYLIEINDDWIIRIEQALPFIEKAIAEERQFIRTNGEIVPIEKVKKTSRDSIVHLARHSNLITHAATFQNFIPDKLYIVEKLSDYAVYENRFLYMLLTYLNEFISYRIEKIELLNSTYKAAFSIYKEYKSKYKDFTLKLEFNEEERNNPFTISDDKCKELLQRMKDCLQIVNSYLKTDLMIQVSASPMVKPPIVKTNVLKMNKNFINALALYDYISSFKGLGFNYSEVEKSFTPFNSKSADELYDSISNQMVLTYIYGNEIEELMEENYKLYLEEQYKLEQQKLQEKIDRMRKKVFEKGETMEEYMVLLEQRNTALLSDSEELKKARIKIEALNEEIEGLKQNIEELDLEIIKLNDNIDELNRVIEEKDKEIAYLKQKYIDDMAAQKKYYEDEIERINTEHKEEILALNTAHSEEINRLNNEWATKLEEEITAITDQKDEEMELLKSQISDMIQDATDALQEEYDDYKEEASSKIEAYEAKIDDLEEDNKNLNSNVELLNNTIIENKNNYESEINKKENECNQAIEEIKEACEKDKNNAFTEANDKVNAMDQEKNTALANMELMKAELRALRIDSKLDPLEEDFTSREKFIQLEDEYKIFNDFFMNQWKLTKKQIKKDILGKKIKK